MTYKIYAVEIDKFGPPALLITAAIKNYNGSPMAESILVIPGDDDKFTLSRVGFSSPQIPSSPIEIDEEFMLEEALYQAKASVASYINARFDKSPHLIPADGPKLEETSSKFLVQTWTRNHGQAFFDIAARTRNTELSDLLYKVIDYPAINLS